MKALNWDLLRYFYAVAQHGTVSAAAMALAVSHATVLRRIDALESILEVTLFEHHQTGYVLTATGESILPLAEQMMKTSLALENQVKGLQIEPLGPVNVYIHPALMFLIMPLCEAFLKRYPGMSIQVCAEIDDAELIFTLSNSPDQHYVGRKLGQLSFGYYCDQTYWHRLNGDTALTPTSDHVAQMNWLVWQGPQCPFDSEALLRYLTPTPIIRMRGDYPQILHALFAQLGAAIIVDADAARFPQLTRLPYLCRAPEVGIWLLTPPALKTVARIRAWLDFIITQLPLR